jgi:hypothetical protein
MAKKGKTCLRGPRSLFCLAAVDSVHFQKILFTIAAKVELVNSRSTYRLQRKALPFKVTGTRNL